VLVHLRGVEGESIFDFVRGRKSRLVWVEGRHLLLVVKETSKGSGQEMLRGVTLSETLDVHFGHVMMLREYLWELVLGKDETLIMRVVEPFSDGFTGTLG
jgi:hypothetical protein